MFEKMAKNFSLQDDEKLAKEVQKYKCLYDKPGRAYKERDRVANAWVAVEMALNLSDGNDDHSVFIKIFATYFSFTMCFHNF